MALERRRHRLESAACMDAPRSQKRAYTMAVRIWQTDLIETRRTRRGLLVEVVLDHGLVLYLCLRAIVCSQERREHSSSRSNQTRGSRSPPHAPPSLARLRSKRSASSRKAAQTRPTLRQRSGSSSCASRGAVRVEACQTRAGRHALQTSSSIAISRRCARPSSRPSVRLCRLQLPVFRLSGQPSSLIPAIKLVQHPVCPGSEL